MMGSWIIRAKAVTWQSSDVPNLWPQSHKSVVATLGIFCWPACCFERQSWTAKEDLSNLSVWEGQCEKHAWHAICCLGRTMFATFGAPGRKTNGARTLLGSSLGRWTPGPWLKLLRSQSPGLGHLSRQRRPIVSQGEKCEALPRP